MVGKCYAFDLHSHNILNNGHCKSKWSMSQQLSLQKCMTKHWLLSHPYNVHWLRCYNIVIKGFFSQKLHIKCSSSSQEKWSMEDSNVSIHGKHGYGSGIKCEDYNVFPWGDSQNGNFKRNSHFPFSSDVVVHLQNN